MILYNFFLKLSCFLKNINPSEFWYRNFSYNKSFPGNANFFRYFIEAGGGTLASSFSEWWDSRVVSFMNTLIPMHLSSFYHNHPWFHGVQPTPRVVRNAFSFFNTLPFGVGIFYYFIMLYQLILIAIKKPFLFTGLILLQFLLFWVYWGSNILGLLPEGMHTWVVCIFLLIVCAIFSEKNIYKEKIPKWQNRIVSLRGIDVFLMLLLSSRLTANTLGFDSKVLDSLMLFFMTGCLIGLMIISYRIWLTPIEKVNLIKQINEH